MEDGHDRHRALNLGLIINYVLHINSVMTAIWVTLFWLFQLLVATFYLFIPYEGNCKTGYFFCLVGIKS